MKSKRELPASRYVERDVSWMYFNQRILLEAAKKNVPLLERLSFLGIYSNNLDEFFRVRVATLNRIMECEDKDIKKERENAQRIFKQINKLNTAYTRQLEETFQDIVKDLEAQGIYLVNERQLTERQKDYIRDLYQVDLNGSTFPYFLSELKHLGELADSDIYLAIRLTKRVGERKKKDYALIEMPVNEFGRFIRLPDDEGRICLMFLDDVVRFCLPFIFVGMDYDQYEAYTFKFTKDTGEGYVHMRLSHAGRDNVEISITDNGEGISAEHINNIFDSFYQADVHHSGSGIGLVLSKAFAELHGGSITVKSAEGRGSVFTVVLPVMQEDPVMPGMAEPGSEMWKFRDGAVYDASQETISTSLFSDEDISESKKTVLVIDDNRDVREYLKSVLSFEYNIIEASSGEEGLRQAGKRVPDAIICDVMMPGMDGMECCRRLKSDIRTSHIPVLMLTAYAAEEQKIKGYECGADSYISKPFSSDLLQARLANLIEGRKMLLSVFGDPCSVTGHSVPDVDKNFIDRFRAIINSRIADPSLTVESIGEEIGLSRVQLYRKTKALIGYSPNEFLRICRLRKAAAMLSSTDRSVSEVAYGVGFSSPSYFTRCYREYFGENPVSARNSPVSPVSGNINSPVLR